MIKEKPLYFARKMHKGMKGLGTDDSALVRVIVSRCEVDMVQIKAAFKKEFNGELAQWLKVCMLHWQELLSKFVFGVGRTE